MVIMMMVVVKMVTAKGGGISDKGITDYCSCLFVFQASSLNMNYSDSGLFGLYVIATPTDVDKVP